LAAGLAGRVLDSKSDTPAKDIERAEALLAPALRGQDRPSLGVLGSGKSRSVWGKRRSKPPVDCASVGGRTYRQEAR
jgi:hypothetical protein